ncbi:MAG: hypothetical protein QJR14_08315 [Bacillota bacterium]|nr:hypothetical protein [Bacillota bacterium]
MSATTGLFTYSNLGTLAGASLATALVLEAIRPLPGLHRLPARLVALPVATLLLALAEAARGDLRPGDAPLLVLNGLLVASAATSLRCRRARPSSVRITIAYAVRRKGSPQPPGPPPASATVVTTSATGRAVPGARRTTTRTPRR